jgi:hypothetical protein
MRTKSWQREAIKASDVIKRKIRRSQAHDFESDSFRQKNKKFKAKNFHH